MASNKDGPATGYRPEGVRLRSFVSCNFFTKASIWHLESARFADLQPSIWRPSLCWFSVLLEATCLAEETRYSSKNRKKKNDKSG